MMNKLVSVLMCVYNTPVLFLKEAVESIRNQTYDNIKLIIVDDCSDDAEVLQYLEKISKLDICLQLIHNETNRGLTRSLNIGLRYCEGDYVARMDADDISMPDRIQTQVNYLESNPEIALVGSSVIIFGDMITPMEIVSKEDDYLDPEIYRIRSLIQHSGPPHPTFMFRRSFLCEHEIKYREEIYKAQDYGIMVDILKAGGVIRKLQTPFLKYRVHHGQITANSEIEQKAYQWKVSYDYLRFLFPELSDMECAAISLLGYQEKWDDLIYAIQNQERLQQTCGFLIENRQIFEKPEIYIQGIKKILAVNKRKYMFSSPKMKHILRSEWWKKALRMSHERHQLWGMRPYTIWSYFL